jgi:putative DNA primase/helicase
MSGLARRCEGLWPSILDRLGLSLSAKALRHQGVPCPMCGGRDRFTFADRGHGLWVCHGGRDLSGCDARGDGVKLVMRWCGVSFAEAARLIEATGLIAAPTYGPGCRQTRPGFTNPQPHKIKGAGRSESAKAVDKPVDKDPNAPLRPWFKASPIREGSPVDTYLRNRGLIITVSEAKSLRSHPHLWHWPSRSCWPALVALVRSADGHKRCVQQTFLAVDGSGKAPVDKARLFPAGAPLVGAGVWFGEATADCELIIGEGVESTLSAMRLFDATAGCAALSTSGFVSLVLPPTIGRVRILADYDGAGLSAAHQVARRWRGEGRAVRVSRATHRGCDANDVWIAQLKERGDA